jgi:hypothetical protein
MNLALHKRRLFIAMAITTAGLIVAMAALAVFLAFHIGWALYVFGAAILVGFGSHGWLMLGVLRDKAPTP